MSLFQHFLVAFDGSDQAVRALDTAVDLAAKYGGRLSILSVYRHHSALEMSLSMVRPSGLQSPDEALKAYAMEITKTAKERALAAGTPQVEAFVRRGPPARTIVAFAEEHGCDAVVMGTRGDGDIGGFLLGSVSHKVSGMSPVTCILVK